jgi:hypothetical protein
VAQLLGDLRAAEAVEPMFAALTKCDSESAQSLAEYGDVRALEPLAAALDAVPADYEKDSMIAIKCSS